MPSAPTPGEIAFFDVVDRTAYILHGSRKPHWYLQARIDQMLDDAGLEGAVRNCAGARGLFILKARAQMERPLKEVQDLQDQLKALGGG